MMVGWRFSRRGALSELEVSYALALLEVPDRAVLPRLLPNTKSFFKSARKHLSKKRRADVDRLRASQHVSPVPLGRRRRHSGARQGAELRTEITNAATPTLERGVLGATYRTRTGGLRFTKPWRIRGIAGG